MLLVLKNVYNEYNYNSDYSCSHLDTLFFIFYFWNKTFFVCIPENEEEPGFCKKAVMCFCGLEKSKKAPKLSPEEEAELKRQLTDTSEKPLWRNVVNANAIILLCVAVFFHGYFG